MCNLFSVKKACESVGLKASITSEGEDIMDADAAILPGVGAFGAAIENLKRLSLIDTISDFIKSGKPFMGICLGMQLLFTESEEFGEHEGLDIVKGRVVKFPIIDDGGVKGRVPQVGWNEIRRPSPLAEHFWNKTPLAGIRDGGFMYFVHSYYCRPEDENIVLSTTRYNGIEYCSSILHENIFASQFHPEKSGSNGLEIYRNWVSYIRHK